MCRLSRGRGDRTRINVHNGSGDTLARFTHGEGWARNLRAVDSATTRSSKLCEGEADFGMGMTHVDGLVKIVYPRPMALWGGSSREPKLRDVARAQPRTLDGGREERRKEEDGIFPPPCLWSRTHCHHKYGLLRRGNPTHWPPAIGIVGMRVP
jgi:hypothetical protein